MLLGWVLTKEEERGKCRGVYIFISSFIRILRNARIGIRRCLLATVVLLIYLAPIHLQWNDFTNFKIPWCFISKKRNRILVQEIPQLNARRFLESPEDSETFRSGYSEGFPEFSGEFLESTSRDTCPMYHFQPEHEEREISPRIQGSGGSLLGHQKKKKAPFTVQTNIEVDIWPQEKGGLAERGWNLYCKDREVKHYVFSNGVVIKQSNTRGQGLAFILTQPSTQYDNNVWHVLQDTGSMWCGVAIAERLAKDYNSILADGPPWEMEAILERSNPSNRSQAWNLNFLNSVFRKVTLAEDVRPKAYLAIRHWKMTPDKTYLCPFNRGGSIWYGQETGAVLLGAPQERYKMQRLAVVKRGLSQVKIPRICGKVIVLRRGCRPLKGKLEESRQFVDSETGTFDGILREFCRAGLNAHGACLSLRVTLAEQYKAIASASVLVSIHGAQLANLVWLSPGSAVVEITLRYGFCCKPLPPEYWYHSEKVCTGPCSPYPFLVYTHMAAQFGIKYYYYDPVYVEQETCENVIDRKRTMEETVECDKLTSRHVLVDSHNLAKAVRGVMTTVPGCVSTG